MSTMKALLGPIVVAALALLGLSSFQDTAFREHIEGKLTESSRTALADADLNGAQVSFTGRDATVEADSPAAAATASAVVGDVTGVRAVQVVGPGGEAGTGAVVADAPDDAVSTPGAEDSGAPETGETADPADGGEGDSEHGDTDGDTDSDPADGSDDGDAQDEDTGDAEDSGHEPTKKEKAEAQDDLVEIPNITFVTDSAKLTKHGRQVVRQAADVLEEHPDVRVRIEGHTDSRGDEDDNLKLSKRRAITVRDRLVELGVDKDRLSYKGFGESDPLVIPRTFADLEKNRRVEFVVLD
ncbi:OmpA family protein [Myceligenerans indicum]|uniref:OmpA family protein n=1 Tax=Myceligenerans indicum TaxID=2593663 RepID=A0ABS1LQU6_9MICO|nr:OmpA family protein [Myceligenerans indicum]MBL0887897.1 OmpA family protein [Myceligenerans indicum]